MTKKDKQIIDRAVKEEWRIGDRIRLKRLLKKNLEQYRDNVELENKNKLLGERCNQLLKDKGNLTDELQELKETLAQTVENDEVAYETLKLHDQEEIGMLNSKVTELENKIADIKANCDLAIEGRDIKIKELEQQIEKMKCCANCKSFKGYGETCEGWGEPVLNLNCDCTEWELKEIEK